MKRFNLGELEELLLLMVSVMHPDAYGVSIREEIKKQAGRTITLSTVHVALHRLEEKGFIKSSFGEATQVRGGKRKRLFQITAYGRKALSETREIRERLWGQIPDVALLKKMV